MRIRRRRFRHRRRRDLILSPPLQTIAGRPRLPLPCTHTTHGSAEVARMARRAFLGIDCGTQSTKALLVDADTLVPLALGRAHHELIGRDDGTREQHPDWWVEALQSATREALAGLQPGAVELAGIGVS